MSVTVTSDRAELVRAVDDIADVIVAGREAAEAEGKLTEAVVRAMADKGFTKLYAPRLLGGVEADPVAVALVTEALARLDTAAAWFVMVSNAIRVSAASFPKQLIDTVWGPDIGTVVAASGNHPFRAEKVEGGYCLSGTNSFVSGCHHARWMLSPIRLDDEVRVAILPMDQCTIIDNWHVLGMRGSGSNDVSADEVFVPHHMTAGAGTEGNPYHTGALYRCPGRIVFSTYVPVALALAQTALDEVDRLAQDKRPYATTRELKHRSIAQVKYAKALAIYRATRIYFFDEMETTWQRALRGEDASDDQKADLYLAGTHAVQASAEVVRMAADVAGTSVIYDGSELERIVRDMEVVRHHGFANESRYGSVAQLKWGVELDYPLMLR